MDAFRQPQHRATAAVAVDPAQHPAGRACVKLGIAARCPAPIACACGQRLSWLETASVARTGRQQVALVLRDHDSKPFVEPRREGPLGKAPKSDARMKLDVRAIMRDDCRIQSAWRTP